MYQVSQPDESNLRTLYAISDYIKKHTTIPKEHEEQVGLISWFKRAYPQHFIFAIPNGGHRSIHEAKILKQEGVVAGVFDLQVITNSGMIFFIEMKRRNGKLSYEQKKFGKYLDSANVKWIVGYGAEDASSKIRDLLGY